LDELGSNVTHTKKIVKKDLDMFNNSSNDFNYLL